MPFFFAGQTKATAAVTTLGAITDEIVLDGLGKDLAFVLSNTGAAALTGLTLQAKFGPDDSFRTVLSGADWATTHPLVNSITSGITTLAGSAVGFGSLSLPPWHSIRFQASCGTTTAVSIVVNARLER